ASFTLGLGSEFGKGYVVDIKLRTLEPVPETIREEIEKEALRFLRRKIGKAFPGRKLSVTRDGTVIKIYGDLSLGTA
ncbi:MAG: hypothetical protein ONB12_09150, partial [candidate division KSB1 bacterium]|nr:hypothetical protein [candidate division KSB1 bacterium]